MIGVLIIIGFEEMAFKDVLNKSLAILAGMAGLFYIAVVISRLVSLYHWEQGKPEVRS